MSTSVGLCSCELPDYSLRLSLGYQVISWPIQGTPPGGGVTCICRDTRMCHYFGYFFGVAPEFLGTFLGYSRIFGYHFLIKLDFFLNYPDFGVLILIFPSMKLWNVACRALVSMKNSRGGFLNSFFARGWGIRPSKKIAQGGRWSGLELTDTLKIKRKSFVLAQYYTPLYISLIFKQNRKTHTCSFLKTFH